MNETKNHIIQIALKLFLQKNFKEVTMKEIVDRTGLSKGAFYHYFNSKEQLFAEIIDFFFVSITQARNDKIENVSLYDFYNENIKSMNDFSFFAPMDAIENSATNFFSINFFSLMFDALKLFPDFRDKMEEYHKKEFKNWLTVIQNAQKNNEIKTVMEDEQIARLFIFAADGLTLNLTLKGTVEKMKNEVKYLWDKIYELIKN